MLLKSQIINVVIVAPLVGAWIEIFYSTNTKNMMQVAPLVGAWIEIIYGDEEVGQISMSHPSWVRGLKYAP